MSAWWRPLVVITSVNLFFSPSQVALTSNVAQAAAPHRIHCFGESSSYGQSVLPRSLRTMPTHHDGPDQAARGQATAGEPTRENERARFYDSIAVDFDTTSTLRWSFLLEGITEETIEPLIETLHEMGFGDVEPMTDENHEGHYVLWLAEARVHTPDSFAKRARLVEELAARAHLTVADYAAGCDTH